MITIEIGRDRRVYSAEDLPLSVGGAGCHVALPSLDNDEPVAYLGHDHEQLFIQPAEGAVPTAPLSCNGVTLTTSRWLGDRDEIEIRGHRLRFEIVGDSARLMLIQATTNGEKGPTAGISDPPPAAPPGTAITPAEFEPRWGSPPRRARFTIRPRSLLVAAAIVLLGLGAYLLVTRKRPEEEELAFD